jgi:hypothetical protein
MKTLLAIALSWILALVFLVEYRNHNRYQFSSDGGHILDTRTGVWYLVTSPGTGAGLYKPGTPGTMYWPDEPGAPADKKGGRQ